MAQNLIKATSAIEEMLPIKKIRKDGGTQPRSNLDQVTIERYAESIKSGYKLPACDIHYDGTNYWLSDGFHRDAAYQICSITEIPVIIHQGSLRDAILFSKGANAEHGLPRSENDKRRAVVSMLADEEWSKWSNREIAKACKVSEYYVRSVKADLSTIESQIAGTDVATDTTNYPSKSLIEETARNTGLAAEVIVAAKSNVEHRQETILARRGNSVYEVKTEKIGKNRKSKANITQLPTAEISQTAQLHNIRKPVEQSVVRLLKRDEINSVVPVQEGSRERLKDRLDEVPAEILLHPRTEGKPVEVPDFTVNPGSWWMLSKIHLLFCGSILQSDFLTQLPSDIELILNFDRLQNNHFLPIHATSSVNLPLDFSDFDSDTLSNFVSEVLISNTDAGDNCVVVDTPDPNLLLKIHTEDCIFYCAASTPAQCKDIIWFWRMTGRTAIQIN